jgi:Family of unknown function (DUF5996)
MTEENWPALPLEAWEPTRTTLHMWTQVVGKVRLALSPYMNHWWHVPLCVTARGLTTSPIPYEGETFEIVFDFIEHNLLIQKNDGTAKTLRLAPRSVAEFYAEVMAALRSMGIAVKIWTMPVEIPNPIPFDQDRFGGCGLQRIPRTVHRQGEPGVLLLGHLRFGGDALFRPPRAGNSRRRSDHEGGLLARGEQRGRWPGDAMVKEPAFFSYAAPQPSGFPKAPVRPAAASYNTDLSQFLLRYDDVRSAASPRQALLDFCQSTYEAAATLGKWDRAELEHNA